MGGGANNVRRHKKRGYPPPGEASNRRSCQHAAHDHFQREGRKRKVISDEKHGAGNYAGVVSEKKASQSGKNRSQINKAASWACWGNALQRICWRTHVASSGIWAR